MLTRLMVSTVISVAVLLAAIFSAKADGTFFRSGNWSAGYMAKNADGSPVCTMHNDHLNQERSVYVKWFPGTPGLTIQLYKDSWRIPSGTNVAVRFGFDSAPLGSLDTALGGMLKSSTTGQNVSGYVAFRVIEKELLAAFVSEWGNANKMWFQFGGTEQPWIIDMTGSRDVIRAFLNCVDRVPVPTVPYGKQPETSQPFGSPGFEPDRPKKQPAGTDRAA